MITYTHIPTQIRMGTKNISISEEAYARLVALKKPDESFRDVVNQLTTKRSILEMACTLTEEKEKRSE